VITKLAKKQIENTADTLSKKKRVGNLLDFTYTKLRTLYIYIYFILQNS